MRTRGVAVDIAALERRAAWREARVPECQRHEDPAAQLTLETGAGCPLDHHAEENVVRAGVGEMLAGPSDRTFGERHTHHLTRRPAALRFVHRPARELPVV